MKHILTILCFFLLLACNKLPTENQSAKTKSIEKNQTPVIITLDQDQQNEIQLQTTLAKYGLIKKTVDSPGRVGPNAELSRLVSTPSAGRALDVRARLGDAVIPGQVMAIIKSDPIGQVQSDLLQNALQVKADIKQQEVQLKLSRITFERESKLYKEQVSAKADLQAAENQLEKDEANLVALKAKLDALITAAQERLTLLGAPPDSAKKVLSQKKLDPLVFIRAPEEGIVIDRSINPGELTDGTKPLFTIADLSQVWLFADIYEKDIEEVKKGQEAIVSIDSLPEEHKFPAKIIWVGDSVNPVTRTLSVRANVANPAQLLKPGMFARMQVNVGNISVLLVPQSAVVQKGDKSFVFVKVSPDSYEEKEVQTGIEDVNNIEIKSGLQAGQTIVSQGGTALLGTAMKTAEGKAD